MDIVPVWAFRQKGYGLGRIFVAVHGVPEVQRNPHFFALNIVEQAQRFGGRVNETVTAGLARFVFDAQRYLRFVTAGFTKGFDQIFPGRGIIILEGKFIAVAQGAAGHFVGTDGSGKIFGFFDKAHGFVTHPPVVGGQTAVAKLGLGLDIHIYGGNIEAVFV